MVLDPLWLLLALPVAFALGWLASRLEMRQWVREQRDAPKAYFKGLNLLLNEQQDKAIDAFVEAVQDDPHSADLHFALGNLFRRRGEFERAVRVHQHLLRRGDLSTGERERAQHALAQDFMKAGLFDRAEEAFRALEGTPFDTEARLALLTLHERSRDWRAAAEVAARLEKSGIGSFATRIGHYWCEVAQEADARGDAEGAQAALQRAREVAPTAPRPWLLEGERHLRAGRVAQALQAWDELRARHPGTFPLVAAAYAQAALTAGQRAHAREQLELVYAQQPDTNLLAALRKLDTPEQAAQRLLDHLRQQPALSVAAQVLELPPADWAEDTRPQLQASVARAAQPMQRYRCAACGFEARNYFWQCPGCQGWDTYPPRRIEDL
ncbi:lipopolysaccharide assembly protein LapB [Azohydromonas caseinilytica]|uniref:Lipopolysaccharide assembly protein B n=1 Tax=Azohydromonas caseinilytica TaxID=2728836 RepID=A0A848F458_9BURK|nr:lipopolysaccharide assembly protein LapB [Azohydromonas caseinilytica]NML14172.1 lipopolysaccharide assembly protein LapB [Azohydromonas caseinilytica]